MTYFNYDPGRGLDGEERKQLDRIQHILAKAQAQGWNDIVEAAASAKGINNRTRLKDFYRKVSAMAKARGDVPNFNPNPKPNPKPAMADQGHDNKEVLDPVLQAPPVRREYTQNTSASGHGQATTQPIPEASFGHRPAPAPEPGPGSAAPGSAPDFGGGGLPPREQQENAEKLAKVLIDLYCDKVPQLAAWPIRTPESKITQLHRSGEIDMNTEMAVPAGAGTVSMTFGEYLRILPEQIKAAVTPDEQWKAGVFENLVIVLKKKGAGITPEQTLMLMVGQHLVGTALAVLSVRGDIERMMKDMREFSKGAGSNRSTPPPPPPPPPPGQDGGGGDGDLPLTPAEEVREGGAGIVFEQPLHDGGVDAGHGGFNPVEINPAMAGAAPAPDLIEQPPANAVLPDNDFSPNLGSN
ncbi:MAG TPA: hypothetical protein PKZ07_14565 [Sedimentisphaerales bacterium]|nr:hypothetical protein [Sedimentisphaerales bacterium]